EELRRYSSFLSQSVRPAQLIYELSRMPEASLYPPLEGLDELRPQELSDLLSIEENTAFLIEAYQLIFGRPADPDGLQTHLSQLKTDSRPGVLFSIVLSREAQRLPRQFLFNGRLVTENSEAPKRHGFREVVAGIMARLGNALLPGTQTRLAAIENQMTLQAAAIDEVSGIFVPELLEPIKSWPVAIREGLVDVLVKVDKLSSAFDQHRTHFDARARKLEVMESDLRALKASQERAASTLDYYRVEEWAASGRFTQRIEAMESQQAAANEHLRQLSEQISLQKPVFPVGDRLLATVINGFLMLLPADDVRLSTYMAIRGYIDLGMVRFLSRILQSGMTFVDIGANIGTHTLTAASRVQDSGHVYSFEPTPSTCGILRTNATINGFIGRVVIQELAVSDKRGTAKLWTGDVCGHNTLFGSEADPRPAITVSTISLDEALAGVPIIDFIKIDAEGAEPFILRGMREILSRNPKLELALEFAPVWLAAAGLQPSDFLDEMLEYGFIIEQIDDLTGETVAINREKILHAESINLYLRRNAI
ncbi:MAG: FkbM family methyltransferase, partial [Bryobacteraceae bacterium]